MLNATAHRCSRHEITSTDFAFSTENYTKGILDKLLCSDCLEIP